MSDDSLTGSLLVVVSIFCIITTYGITKTNNEKELIKRGFAYYHPTTAEFTWKTEDLK
jgi:hypothetical protein